MADANAPANVEQIITGVANDRAALMHSMTAVLEKAIATEADAASSEEVRRFTAAIVASLLDTPPSSFAALEAEASSLVDDSTNSGEAALTKLRRQRQRCPFGLHVARISLCLLACRGAFVVPTLTDDEWAACAEEYAPALGFRGALSLLIIPTAGAPPSPAEAASATAAAVATEQRPGDLFIDALASCVWAACAAPSVAPPLPFPSGADGLRGVFLEAIEEFGLSAHFRRELSEGSAKPQQLVGESQQPEKPPAADSAVVAKGKGASGSIRSEGAAATEEPSASNSISSTSFLSADGAFSLCATSESVLDSGSFTLGARRGGVGITTGAGIRRGVPTASAPHASFAAARTRRAALEGANASQQPSIAAAAIPKTAAPVTSAYAAAAQRLGAAGTRRLPVPAVADAAEAVPAQRSALPAYLQSRRQAVPQPTRAPAQPVAASTLAKISGAPNRPAVARGASPPRQAPQPQPAAVPVTPPSAKVVAGRRKRNRSESCALDGLLDTPQQTAVHSTPLRATPLRVAPGYGADGGGGGGVFIPATPSPTKFGISGAPHQPTFAPHAASEEVAPDEAFIYGGHGRGYAYERSASRPDEFALFSSELPETPTPKEKRASAIPPSPY